MAVDEAFPLLVGLPLRCSPAWDRDRQTGGDQRLAPQSSGGQRRRTRARSGPLGTAAEAPGHQQLDAHEQHHASATLPVAVRGDAHAWARGIGVVGLALAYLLALLKVATHAA